MELNFKLQKIKPRADLSPKLKNLGISENLDRIRATLRIENENQKIDIIGILDTGATISLLPISIQSYFPNLKMETHTMWGVINNDACRFTVSLAEIPLKLIDSNGQISQTINIPVALAHLDNAPILIGMKGLLEKYSYQYTNNDRIFTLRI